MPLTLGFVVCKEERLVLLYWSTQRSAKLVQVELFFGRSEKALGIEIGVAEVLIERSVQLVGARFCGNQHGRTRARTVFRRVVIGQNLEFLDGVDGRQNCNSARAELVVVDVIEQPVGALHARSTD